MCGIFGVTITEHSRLSTDDLKRSVEDLFVLSESRGKEAAGLAILTPEAIHVHKEPSSASRMIRSRPYRAVFADAVQNGSGHGPGGRATTIIGHSRLVTNGAQEFHHNNQPVVGQGLIGIHNGIIVNDDDLWRRYPLERRYQVDTEVLLSLVRHFLAEGRSLIEATRETFGVIEGAASIACVFEEFNYLLLATNNGSLYTCRSATANTQLFASEKYILQMLLKKRHWRRALGDCPIEHIESGMGLLVDTETLAVERFSLDPRAGVPANGHKRAPRRVIDPQGDRPVAPSPLVLAAAQRPVPPALRDHVARVNEAVSRVRRCTRCVLPETMPFIEFDQAGVCNYCRNYHPMDVRGEDALREFVQKFRRGKGEPDCVVTFSGGRDSSYGLHYAKVELGLNPIAYTYDWGMVTDLGRRNQARICGKLGVEHVLISADISQKRRNIRLNVNAWLKRPDLGTIPLFMAGDKQYFYYANKLREQTGCELVVLCENMLETTGFKSGYCGIRPSFGTAHTYTLTLASKLKLAAYYGRQYLRNPAYINRSLLDAAHAYWCYYFIPHDYLNLFNYVRWEEQQIDQTLHEHYDWEVATDTNSTWRIGDGTSPFYNYIYYVISGFTENDTFRSNQIREGMLTRDKALATVQEENQPRYESIQWYCDTIGLDFERTIARINEAPTCYPLQ